MKREIAARISELMLDISARLNDSVRLVQETCSEKEFESYRVAVSEIMGHALIDVLNPLYQEHPDLKPEQLR